jgi:Ca2+-binding RTX toxin-like protein
MTGRHILTAAHCVTDDAGVLNVTRVDVRFEMPDKDIIFEVYPDGIHFPSGWNGNLGSGYDIALLELPSLAPSGPTGENGTGAERYDIYRGSSEVGQNFSFAGYGMTGTGSTGQVQGTGGTKRKGQNTFSIIQHANRALAVDFDSGQPGHDGYGDGAPLDDNETAFAQGDSGGGAVINGDQIAGVLSYMYGTHINTPPRFGDVNVFTRVSAHQEWIDSYLDSSHNFVLDLRKQVKGNDGSPDTIEAKRNGAFLELWVNGQLYHSEPLNGLLHLSIWGSDDDEAITVSSLPYTSITVVGGEGEDTLTINGTNEPDQWILRKDELVTSTVGLNEFKVHFVKVEEVTANALGGADTIRVVSTQAPVRYSINAGSHNDVVRVGQSNGSGAWVLDGIQGNLKLNGGLGTDTLFLHDEGQSTGQSYSFLNTQLIFRFGIHDISHSQFSTVKVLAGSGADTFSLANLTTPLGASSVELWGGNGSDKIIGPDDHNASDGLPWSIADYNKVRLLTGPFGLGGVTAFVENVQGGAGPDRFYFAAGKSLSGNLDGGGGINQLLYPTWTTDVTVNLRTGTATGVFGSVSHIQHVTGGSGNDILVGDAQSNTLTGGGGRDLLIGGAGADWLEGGLDDDLLIGGTTAYDTNNAALAAMRVTWTQADKTYDQRIAEMRRGAGDRVSFYKLDTTTVFEDLAADTLLGGTGAGMGLDWFWVFRSDLTDGQWGEQIN